MAKGTIKFFNTEKGFGFIKKENGGDLFFHKSVISNSGFSESQMVEGVPVEFIEGERDGRACATKFISVSGQKPSLDTKRRNGSRSSFRGSPKRELAVGATGIGKVVVFNEDKGFGFLQVIGNDVADVFFHVSNIPESVSSHDPKEGDSFHFEVIAHGAKTKARITKRYEPNSAKKPAEEPSLSPKAAAKKAKGPGGQSTRKGHLAAAANLKLAAGER